MKKAKLFLVCVLIITSLGGVLAFKVSKNKFGSIVYEGPNGAGTSSLHCTIEVDNYKLTTAVPGIAGYYTSLFSAACTTTRLITVMQ